MCCYTEHQLKLLKMWPPTTTKQICLTPTWLQCLEVLGHDALILKPQHQLNDAKVVWPRNWGEVPLMFLAVDVCPCLQRQTVKASSSSHGCLTVTSYMTWKFLTLSKGMLGFKMFS